MWDHDLGGMMRSMVQTWMLSVENMGDTVGVSDFCLESRCWVSLPSDFVQSLNVNREITCLFCHNWERKECSESILLGTYHVAATCIDYYYLSSMRAGILFCFCLPWYLQHVGQHVARGGNQ